jgi:phenylacetic acid degradation operon negative regulatory protein
VDRLTEPVGETRGGGPTGAAAGIPTRVLVLGMARDDGSIAAADLAPVATACGLSPEQVRSCLRRLVGEGLFVRDGEGRQAVYRPTAERRAARRTEAGRGRRAYAQDRADQAWDGRWHLVAFAVPESRRSARDALRERLGALGGAAVQNGLYVSPHAWEKDVLAQAERLDLAEQITLATSGDLTVGGESDPVRLARRLWPVDDLARRYQAFVDEWGGVPDELARRQAGQAGLSDGSFVAGGLAMGVAFLACYETDPLLPPELLPRPWPGREARRLVVRSRARALGLRAGDDRPGLFRSFDALIDALR